MISASLSAVCFLCFSVVHSQSEGTFINPPPQDSTLANPSAAGDPVYTVGKLLPISWVPLVNGTMTITMWQADPSDLKKQIGNLQYLPGSQNIDISSYNWNPIGVDGNNGNPNFNLSASNIFFFDLYQSGGTSPLSVTEFFNLTDSSINAVGQPISTSTTSSSSTSTSQSTATTASSSPLTTSAPSTSAASTSAASSTSAAAATSSPSGLTTGARVGIGLGVGLGVPILLAILAGIFLLLRKKKNNNTPAYAEAPTGPLEYKQPEYKHEMPSPQPHTAEMESNYGGSPPQPSWQQPAAHELPLAQYR